jgi:ERCC4-type nuclease
MVTMLDTGDIQAVTDDGCTLIIERKTVDDFLNTLRDDRLFPQLARMTDHKNAQIANHEPVTSWPYLVIESPLQCNREGKVVTDRGVTGWSWAAIQGTLLSVQELGICVTFANGQADYEDAILRLGKRTRSPGMGVLAPRVAKMLGPKIDFLTGIQGIGPENAQKILDWSGNNVAHALCGLVDLDVPAPVPMTVRKRLRTNLLSMSDNESLEIILHGDVNRIPVEGELAKLIGEKINA